MWPFYGRHNKAKLLGAVWPHLLWLWRFPCPADAKPAWKVVTVCLCVCGRVCACICLAKRGKRSWKKNIPIKIVHKTVKLLSVHRPCGSDCTSHSSLFLPLASSIASSLLWSLPSLFTGLTPSVVIHTQTLPVYVFSPSFFLSFPPWVSPRLWSASQTCTSLSPFLFLLCRSPVFLSHASYEPIPLFLWVSSIAYFLSFPHTNTSSQTYFSQPRSPGIILLIIPSKQRYETRLEFEIILKCSLAPEKYVELTPLSNTSDFVFESLIWGKQLLDKQDSKKAWIWHSFSITFLWQQLIEDLKEIKI